MVRLTVKVVWAASVSVDFFNVDTKQKSPDTNVVFRQSTLKKRCPFGNPLEFPEKRQSFHSNDRVRYDVRTRYIRSP